MSASKGAVIEIVKKFALENLLCSVSSLHLEEKSIEELWKLYEDLKIQAEEIRLMDYKKAAEDRMFGKFKLKTDYSEYTSLMDTGLITTTSDSTASCMTNTTTLSVDGRIMYVSDHDGNTINRYSLSTPHDLTTAIYEGSSNVRLIGGDYSD